MGQELLLLCLCLLGLSSTTERNENGILKLFDGRSFSPNEEPVDFTSHGYPDQVTYKLNQIGRYFCGRNYPDEPTVMRFTCPLIDVPKSPDGNCKTKVTIGETMSNKKKTYCGLYQDITELVPATDVVIEIKTEEPSGGGVVYCKIDCVWVKPNGEVQPPTTHPYLSHEFEEEDSSEHGVGPATKSTSCPCGMANKVSSRIVNGTSALPNEFPFIAAILEKKDLWQFCGGPIITQNHVLTAAHCTEPFLNVPLAVRVGAYDLREAPKPSDIIDVERIIQHENFQRNQYNAHDISLLVLKREIQFSPLVGSVCLPTQRLNLAHKHVKIIGWGAERTFGPGIDVLQKVNVRVLKMEECAISWKIPVENPIHMCTYRTSKGSCQGDSGGPVIWLDAETNRYTVVGLVSFGHVCGDTHPSFHADVGAHLPWIHNAIAASKKPGVTCNKI